MISFSIRRIQINFINRNIKYWHLPALALGIAVAYTSAVLEILLEDKLQFEGGLIESDTQMELWIKNF